MYLFNFAIYCQNHFYKRFVEFIGVTDDELIAVKDKNLDVEALYKKLGSDITNYHRESVV